MRVKPSVTVSAPARLHFGLLDCGNTSLRVFGGAGASIDGFRTVVQAERSQGWKLNFPQHPPSDRLASDVAELLKHLKLSGLASSDISIQSTPAEHMGLGSKTSLLLSIVHAVNYLNDSTLSREEVIRLSGRGGTSGIGVNVFWSGGIITDSGHKSERGSRDFQPSSSRKYNDPPKLLVHVKSHPHLRVRLFRDSNANSIEGVIEREAFRSLMPIADVENLKAIAAVYQGVIPAFQSDDMALLANALHELNTSGMKAAEAAFQSNTTKQWLARCWQNSIPAGLSSFGPIVYSIGHVGSDLLTSSSHLAKECGLDELGEYSFDHKGATVS
jgi:beta-ribofuranosylaminobenzene 5'-phosphate synthase